MSRLSPAAQKKAIGDRLRANRNYAPLLEEMARCWRLNYAGEFHLDITPSIPNPNCRFGGELVPDKALKRWKPSNPKGYRRMFEERAKLVPVIRIRKHIAADSRGQTSSPTPRRSRSRASSAASSRSRSAIAICSSSTASDVAPLSVIITTLASRSYEWCVRNREYDNELELVFDVIRHMPDSIDTREIDGVLQWFIWNETTAGENFAEKWNRRPERAEAFFTWHVRFCADIAALPTVRGIDRLGEKLTNLFGQKPANDAIANITEQMSTARMTGNLRVTPKVA